MHPFENFFTLQSASIGGGIQSADGVLVAADTKLLIATVSLLYPSISLERSTGLALISWPIVQIDNELGYFHLVFRVSNSNQLQWRSQILGEPEGNVRVS